MAFGSETRTFQTLMTYTIDARAEEGGRSFVTSNPLLDLLYRKGRVTTLAGGARIDVDVEFGFNPGAQWYTGADVLDMTPFELATQARYDWKNLHAPVTHTGEEVRKNRGEFARKNLVKRKIESTEMTHKKVLEIALFGDGTANNGKVILGLDAMLPITPTADPAVGAIGGIPAAANPFWNNQAVTSFGSFAANGPGGTAADAWLTAWANVTDGNEAPDIIISAFDVFSFYNRALVDQSQIIMSKNATGDLTFPMLSYNGVPWVWSRSIPNGRAYFLRARDFEFFVNSEANYTLSDWVQSFNQDLFGAKMLTMCAFTMNRRVFSTVIDGITA